MTIFIALILLALRLWGTYFYLRVVRVQSELLKRPIDEEIAGFRADVHTLTKLLAASSITPIVFDIYVIFRELEIVPWSIPMLWVLSIYTLSNALTFVLSGFLFQKIYRSALEIDKTHPSDHSLMNNEDRVS